MECPNCYNEEVHGSGFDRIVKRSYLSMERVGYDADYDYYQCPRCTLLRKQQTGFMSSGLIENMSHEEAKDMVERASKGGSAFGALVLIGAGILLIGALASKD